MSAAGFSYVQVVFLLVLIAFFVLYRHARQYLSFFAALDKEEFPLPQSLLAMGHALLQAVRYKYSTPYDQGLHKHLLELYGSTNARYFLQVFWANKLAYLLLGVLLVSFFLAALGAVDAVLGSFPFAFRALFLAPDYDLKEGHPAPADRPVGFSGLFEQTHFVNQRRFDATKRLGTDCQGQAERHFPVPGSGAGHL